jgi:hypothetical protein
MNKLWISLGPCPVQIRYDSRSLLSSPGIPFYPQLLPIIRKSIKLLKSLYYHEYPLAGTPLIVVKEKRRLFINIGAKAS